MALVKKINDGWEPSENPGLKVGDTIEVTNYESLVKGGMAVLVDEAGNEVELPNQPFTCPICFEVNHGLMNFVAHVSDNHGPKPTKETQEAAAKAIAGTPEPVTVEPIQEEVSAPEGGNGQPPPEVAEAVAEAVAEETPEQKAARLKAQRVANLARGREAAKAKKALEQAL
jgi:hypothetical protein